MSPRQLFPLEDDDKVDDAPSVPSEKTATFDWTYGLIASVAFASAVVAYGAGFHAIACR